MKKHLMSDPEGDYPIGSLNTWEREIVERELARPDCVGWYRNPSHNGVDSLTVAYLHKCSMSGGERADTAG